MRKGEHNDGRFGEAASVITGLDHVVVLTGDIRSASAAYETLFARGIHELFS